MTQLTNFGENKLCDKVRGTTPPYHATNWYVGFASAADDGTFTEITGADLPRVAIPHDLASWAGTQGAGTTLASSGTSHTTSNNIDINFAAAASNRGDANFVLLFDALTGGNAWVWTPMPTPITINNGDTPSIPAGALLFSLGLANGATDYLANKLIDEFFRGQAYAYPANTYPCLFTAAPSNAGGGTEVAGGSYARPAIASSTAAWSGTQSAGSTSASSGTGGHISNNNAVSFPAPSADWGVIVAEGIKDALTVGNLLFQRGVTPKTISNGGSPPSYAAGKLGITFG